MKKKTLTASPPPSSGSPRESASAIPGLSASTVRSLRQESEPVAIDLFITPNVLSHARPHDACKCIVALAVKAAQPWATLITVDANTIRWTDEESGRRYIMVTPDYAAKQIEAFDNPATRAHVQPFTVRLEGYAWSRAKGTPRKHAPKTAAEIDAMAPAARARYEKKVAIARENIGYGNTTNRYLGYRFPAKSTESEQQ